MKSTSHPWCAFTLTLLLASSLGPLATHAQQSPAPTPAEAMRFIEHAEQEVAELELKAERAAWVQLNFITFDTENIAADAEEAANTAATNYAKLAHRYDSVSLPPELARKGLVVKHTTEFPAPDDPKAEKELAGILTSPGSDYGKGKWCPDGDAKPCLDITKIERLLATSRDPEELKRAWVGWHAVGAPMRDRYARMVELGNAGSRELGYSDVGALWRSKYDMAPDDFARQLDRVWEQLRPLYLLTKPKDRDVVCHASGWDVNPKNDLRIKMCIKITEEDFRVIHHELGHNYYQRAYNKQPPLFQNSANDGFHEAVGDTIALSVTPEYLKTIGLIDVVPPASGDTDYLLRQALEKVAFLPFGLVIDKWRWEVFSGKIKPADYNKSWWELRQKYQGIAPPVARSEADFDPGAKYHVPANVPYMRYFLARIYQFQFQRALCKTAAYH